MVLLIKGWDRSLIDASKTGSEPERILYFNQEDHIRMFGRDFRDRLKAPRALPSSNSTRSSLNVRHGPIRGEKVSLCRKP